MFLLPYSLFSSPEFLKLTYAQFIKIYILITPEMTDARLMKAISRLKPEIDLNALQIILNSKIRCNIGIAPCLMQEGGELQFVGGHSQRTGEGERGVLVTATGLVEETDKTLMDAALRELHEELGPYLYNACEANKDHGIADFQSGLGHNLQEVAANLLAYTQKKKRSISIHANMIIPIVITLTSRTKLLQDTALYLRNTSQAYPFAVKICYEHPKDQPYTQDDYERIKNEANHLLEFIQDPLKTELAQSLNQLNQEENPSRLKALAHCIIEVAENDQLVVFSAKELIRMTALALKDQEIKRIPGKDLNARDWPFFQPALASLAPLLESFRLNLGDEQRRASSRFMQFMKALSNAFSQPTLFAMRPTRLSLVRPTRYVSETGESIQIKKLDLLEELLYASLTVNPRSLGLEGLMGIALGMIYEKFSKNPNSRLDPKTIPSHVNAAEIRNLVQFIRIPAGSELYMYFRPKGWVGQYATPKREFEPSELGIADKISDPTNPEQLIDRVHAQLVVICELAESSAVSQASAVWDFWSQAGRNVYCKGGGIQIYMPLSSSEKSRCFAIVKPQPEDFNFKQLAQLEEIALQNNIQFLTREEIQNLGVTPKPFPTEFTPLAEDAEILLQLAHQAYYLGDFHMAIKALRSYIEKSRLTAYQKYSVQVVLGALYVISGNYDEAQFHLTHFLQNMHKLTDNPAYHPYLRLLASIHLARTQILPEHAVNQFEECLQFIEQNKFDKEIVGKKAALKQLIYLELGIAFNKMARRISACQDYDSFDEEGDPISNKNPFAQNALESFAKLDYTKMAVIEGLIYLLERAWSKMQLRQTQNALEDLILAEEQLAKCQEIFKEAMEHGAFPNLRTELNLLKQNLRLGLVLNLSLSRKYDATVPEVYKDADPVGLTRELGQDLNGLSAMEVTSLFKRWIGPNANNLFVEGWKYTNDDAANPDRGGNLLALYRKYLPIDLLTIQQQLKENQIEELNLAFLGLAPPAGISDEDFDKLCQALASNTSLKKLFLRKCNDKISPERLTKLFDALQLAQEKGQELFYLSYSGVRFMQESNYERCLNFLQNNKSLRVLDFSWYDWKDEGLLKRLAACLGAHPNLRTMLNGINEHPNAGWIFYEACRDSESLHHVKTYDGVLNPQTQPLAVKNRFWMRELQEALDELRCKTAKVSM